MMSRIYKTTSLGKNGKLRTGFTTGKRKIRNKNIVSCKECGEPYEKGFWGTGIKYCSRYCAEKYRVSYRKLWYIKNRKPRNVSRLCGLCKRNILVVGQRKNISKWCSKRCSEIAHRMRKRNIGYITVKIPVKDIPLIFGDLKC